MSRTITTVYVERDGCELALVASGYVLMSRGGIYRVEDLCVSAGDGECMVDQLSADECDRAAQAVIDAWGDEDGGACAPTPPTRRWQAGRDLEGCR